MIINKALFFFRGFMNEDKYVFIVTFHPVFFPCIPFKVFRICKQVTHFRFVSDDFTDVIIPFFLQLVQLAPVRKLGNEIVAVKKRKPDQKRKSGDEVFILQHLFPGLRDPVKKILFHRTEDRIFMMRQSKSMKGIL